LGVNLLGTVFCSQALARDMVQRRRGVVVNIASGRALQGTPRGAHYAASKAGIVSFTKSFALEFAGQGLRCNCVIPGVTETAQPLADTTRKNCMSVASGSRWAGSASPMTSPVSSRSYSPKMPAI
jgi:3-oxoacyl-[acyl-carrier protein] reductase